MYKLVLFACLLMLSHLSFSQISTVYFSEDFNSDKWNKSIDSSNLLIEENLPLGWSVYDSLELDYFWHWSQVGPRGHFINQYHPLEPENLYLNSDYWPKENTIDNGFMMLESDYFNTDSLGFMKTFSWPLSSYVQYGPVDMSNAVFPIIEFSSLFRVCCDPIKGKMQLLISTDYNQESPDDATWQAYNIDFLHALMFSERVKVDISWQTAGEANVYFRWKQMNLSHYFWMLDDVEVYEAPSNEIVMHDYWNEYYQVMDNNLNTPSNKSFHFNGGYTKIPEFTATRFAETRAAVQNKGSNTQNVVLNSSLIKDGEIIENKSSKAYTINYLASDTIVLPVTFDLSTIGSYQVSNTISCGAEDEYKANNSLGFNFEITKNEYSRVYEQNDKNYKTSGRWEYNYGGIQSGEVYTQRFEFFKLDARVVFKQLRFYLPSFKGLEPELNAISASNISVIARIYKKDSDNQYLPTTPVIISSEEYQLTLQDTGSWLTLDFIDEGNLFIKNDVYFVGVEVYTPLVESNLKFGIGVDESAPKQMFGGGQFYNPGQGVWQHSGENYAIELMTETQVGTVDYLSAELVYYPNPVSDIVTLKHADSIESIQLYALDGKRLTEWSGETSTLNLESFKPGIYILTIENINGNRVSTKLIKE